jgi:hypothetical protein
VLDFRDYLHDELLKDFEIEIDESKARRWLIKLGFKVSSVVLYMISLIHTAYAHSEGFVY